MIDRFIVIALSDEGVRTAKTANRQPPIALWRDMRWKMRSWVLTGQSLREERGLNDVHEDAANEMI